MTAAERWVVATGNAGKLAEIQALLKFEGIELVAQSELGIEPPEETATTFVENALIKARHAASRSGLPAIADDSGLAVDALGGAPGVHSARFAGAGADDASNVALLLESLNGVDEERRSAEFHCVMVALRRPDDPAPLIAVGTWRGRIATSRSGERGFGYDPVFFDPILKSTAAQLNPATKNEVSHRGAATRLLARELRRVRGE